MKTTKRIMSLALALICVLTLFSWNPVTADAANVCGCISGDSTTEKTFIVNTGNRFLLADKIKLTQAKGIMNFTNWTGFGNKQIKGNCAYEITVWKTSGGSKKIDFRVLRWNYGNSYTIRLQKNAVYKITVSPINDGDLTLHYARKGTFIDWESPATWWINTTKGISSCDNRA